MTPQNPPGESPCTPANFGAAVWNICLTHDPALAGLYRGINDFARGLDAPILSFDDCAQPRSALAAADGATRISCGPGWIARQCHVMPARAAKQAADALENAELLIVHSLFRAHAPWAARWAQAHGRRYWAVPHGCLDPWSLSQKWFVKRAWLSVHGRAFLRGAERVVFSTQRARDKARAWVPGDNAVIVNWPVEPARLDGRDARRAVFRAQLGIPEDAPLLLFVGRLHPVKRPLETIRSFCEVETPNAHLVMACVDGPLVKSDLVRTIPTSHSGRIHLIGPLSDEELTDAYYGSDGFISLSFQENFGYAAAEALAHGLPVILSPGHDLAYEMPRDSGGTLACGWLLPDDSSAAAGEAINAWASLAAGSAHSRSRLAALGNTGRAWVSETLSFDRFHSVLNRLANASTGRNRHA
jgi:glycosyltransferase involved in cell wall biosynthesis